MSTLFLSHSSHDNPAAAELKAELERRGHRSVFLDFDPEQGIQPGRQWELELYSRLRRAAAVVVLCSRDSLASKWCFAEITQAKALGKPVFPILLDGAAHHPLLADRQALDWTAGRETVGRQLAEALAAVGLAASFRWDPDRSPYPGLLAFEEADAAVFFGRDGEIGEGLETLERLRHFGRPRALVVLGASGSGKSSLVRAGLVPRLRLRRDDWLVVGPLRPGERPERALALALAEAFARQGQVLDWRSLRAAIRGGSATGAEALVELAHDLRRQGDQEKATVLLVVDQMEELLTGGEGSSGTTVLAMLAEATRSREGPLAALFTLRSDLLGRLQTHPAGGRLEFADLKVGPMSRQALLDVVLEPARVHALELEEGLAETIVDDAQGPDALPLLAFALRELWERHGRDDRHLALAEYRDELGGLGGALARVADAEVAAATPAPDGESLRDAFLALARIDEEGRYARRQASWSELPETARPLVERLVDARLLVTHGEEDERTVEVRHEALFRSWDRLAGWLEQDREFLLWRKRLEAEREKWELLERARAALLVGPELEEARKWLAARERSLSAESTDYIRRSLRDAAKRRRLRLALVAGTLAFLFAAAVTSFGLWRRAEEEKARALDRTRVAVASDWMARDPTRAALTLLEIERPDDTVFALAKMREALDAGIAELELAGHADRVLAAAFAPDGRIATAAADGSARVWQTDGSGGRFELPGHAGEVHLVRFDAEGRRVLTAAGETLRVWRADGPGEPLLVARHPAKVRTAELDPQGERVVSVAQDGRARLWRVAGAPDPVELGGDGEEISHAWFSRRGDRVLTVSWQGAVTSRPAGHAGDAGAPVELAAGGGRLELAASSPDRDRLVVVTEEGRATLVQLDLQADARSVEGIGGEPLAVAFGRESVHLLTAAPGGGLQIRSLLGDAAARTLEGGHEGPATAVAASPDGRRLAVASEDGTARVWSLDRHRLEWTLRGHTGTVRAMSFSLDGRRLLTASDDGNVRLWIVGEGGSYRELAGHQKQVVAARFSPDGGRVVTASVDATARVWRVGGTGDAVVLRGHGAWVRKASFDPAGERVVTASQDGTARVWNADGSGSPTSLEAHGGPVVAAAFDGAGRRVLTASEDGTARIWPLAAGGEPVVLSGHGAVVWRAEFSPDGDRVATASHDGTARLWAAGGGREPLVLTGHEAPVSALAFDPRGARVATGSADQTARVWRTDGAGEPIVLAGHAREVASVAFSPDGRRLLTASNDGTARLWSLDPPRELVVLSGHADRLTTAAFSPTGDRIITAAGDATARVWNADGSGAPLVLAGHGARVTAASFSPDGRLALTASEDGTARLWLVSAEALRQAIRVATRVCLEPEFRRNAFGEPPDEAERRHRECESARRG